MLFCYYVFKRYYVFEGYYVFDRYYVFEGYSVSCTPVLLSKEFFCINFNNFNNFNKNLRPHICPQTSTI